MSRNQDESVKRASKRIARALKELSEAGPGASGLSEELAGQRAALEALSQQIELQLSEERQQRWVLTEQITGLAASLDRLVTHLESVSRLMSVLMNTPADAAEDSPEDAAPSEPGEPLFQPGGEGVSLVVAGVPGFQALMDIQKALASLEPVASASVERFQDGDSRIQLSLLKPVAASYLAGALGEAGSQAVVVEESRPELMSLRLKVVG